MKLDISKEGECEGCGNRAILYRILTDEEVKEMNNL